MRFKPPKVLSTSCIKEKQYHQKRMQYIMGFDVEQMEYHQVSWVRTLIRAVGGYTIMYDNSQVQPRKHSTFFNETSTGSL